MDSIALENKRRHVDPILDWLHRASINKEKNRIEMDKNSTLSWGTIQQLNKTTWLLGCFQIALIILFATLGGSEVLDPLTSPGNVTQGYNMFIGVEIMMFVGFGYLMTFLKWYGLGAVGLTMMVTAVGLQWSLFTESFFHQLYSNVYHWHYVDVNIYSLLNCLYAISAVLISFGALIGKISPLQLLSMTIIELILHSVNSQVLMFGVIGLTDIGGTYTDHMFGAYFGLAISFVLGKPSTEPEMGNSPDIFALIGTLFLWIYWPSFVAGAAEADSEQQQRAIVNTIMALSASTVTTFWMSSLLTHNKRFRPVDIQNATLAGGVAIGCSANLTLSPFSAIMIGCTAGIVSTIGCHRIQPYLEERWGLHDTCGIHNLHAMPSVIGGLASVILAGYKQVENHDANVYGEKFLGSWNRQLAGLVLCISFAVVTGLITGFFLVYIGNETKGKYKGCLWYIISLFKNKNENGCEVGIQGIQKNFDQNSYKGKQFHDDSWWEVADDYGVSLYSELLLLINEHEDKENIKGRVSNQLSDWSSHQGRRNKQNLLEFSVRGRKHGSMHEEGKNIDI